ncbi:YdbH domain-containing protein, partial [Salmonella enterica subsp. enterica serovar Montevideo]|nr:YdbH domain-containing protein [Salmonella enterica subsp. enterica serovar Montevideo]
INVDNLGVLTMQAAITGKSRVDGKTAIVNLNYTHEENVFTLCHAGPALYSTLAIKGYFPREELNTLNQNGTRLPSHPDRLKTRG